ncbi:ABC transporter ATP-binding protein [Persicobacter psychrovividus]|uniref:ABC transporter ATP-binding protein n=1 Tax=Persicobacter psychrovividus TaxID=387638 RepID=A0ABN6L8W2_9BACT|nr:ABC transporter ATP-binding protein [Persicobacter psychrovividus]
MKNYLRVLGFARPVGMKVPAYVVFTIFQTIFSLINFTLLIPVLNLLFDPKNAAANPVTALPSFAFTKDYFLDLFNYYFTHFIQVYGPAGALKYVCAVLIVSNLLANLFRYLGALILISMRSQVIYNLRHSLFKKINQLHLGFFTHHPKGDLITRITSDVTEVEASVVNTMTVVFKEPILIISYFFLLFSMSSKLTLTALLVLPVSGGIIASLAKKLKSVSQDHAISFASIMSQLDESLGGIRIIKAFGAEGFIGKRFDTELNRFRKLTITYASRSEGASPLSEFLGVFVVIGLLYIGSSMILKDEPEISGSVFISFMIIFSQVLTPAKNISKSFSNIHRGLVSANRIFTLLDTDPAIKNTPQAIEKGKFNDKISFNNVHFSYDDSEEEVIKGVSFDIKKGQTVALVGPSGGGKSTLADLLPRFFDIQKGSITIDGQDISKLTIESLREEMGIVSQESVLFNDTIHNNIAFGIPNTSREQVMEAAKIANAHQFVSEMEDGYDTIIGERGSKLSGGQRQRISIARAVLKNPEILILDEATSALDTESEKLVQDALNKLMNNRTAFVIAHRLSTIQHAHQILVVQHGTIVERGTHTELLERDGLYKKLQDLQAT